MSRAVISTALYGGLKVSRGAACTAGEVLGSPGDQVVTVESHDDGFVAVGYDEKNGDRNAAVWLSRDGGIWERVPSIG